jgi:hypothetical protein
LLARADAGLTPSFEADNRDVDWDSLGGLRELVLERLA